jgi:hypothetical protein
MDETNGPDDIMSDILNEDEEEDAPTGVTVVKISFRDILGIPRMVVESVEAFINRVRGVVGDGPMDAMAQDFDAYLNERNPLSHADVEVVPTQWGLVSHARFALEAEEGGLEVYRYRGRCSYDGPAVNASSVGEVTRHVTVSTQSDNMGMDVVVYPR